MIRDATNATRWLLTLYTSELSFLFHLPIFLVPILPVDDYYPSSMNEKLGMIKNNIRSAESRKKVLQQRPTTQTWFNFSIVHTCICIIRLLLNSIGTILIWMSLDTIAPAVTSGDDQKNIEYVSQTLHALHHSNTAKLGGYMFLASLGLWLLAYAHHRYHLIRVMKHTPEKVRFPRYLYTICHVGLFNFFLDIPDINIPVTFLTKWVIRGLNVIAGNVFVFVYTIERLMTFAWGCYPTHTTIYGYKYGVCPRYLNNPQNVLSSVCDQDGVVCGNENIEWRSLYTHTIHLCGMLVLYSFILYFILTLDTRIRYYRSFHLFVMEMKTE